jgi:hypothetical protein
MGTTGSPARRALRRRIAAHGLDRGTLELIADALYPERPPERQLEEAEVAQVNEAIDTLVLSGLSDGPTITEALRARGAGKEPEWRESFWRERLWLAAAAWADENAGPRSDDAAPVSTVAAIPPQPPSELGEPEQCSDRLAA